MTSNKCFVPNCTSGYKSNHEKVSLFTTRDPNRLIEWARAIGRSDRALRGKDAVCQKHFRDEDVIRTWKSVNGLMSGPLKKPRLTPNAVPCIFPPLLKPSKSRKKQSLIAQHEILPQKTSHVVKGTPAALTGNTDITSEKDPLEISDVPAPKFAEKVFLKCAPSTEEKAIVIENGTRPPKNSLALTTAIVATDNKAVELEKDPLEISDAIKSEFGSTEYVSKGTPSATKQCTGIKNEIQPSKSLSVVSIISQVPEEHPLVISDDEVKYSLWDTTNLKLPAGWVLHEIPINNNKLIVSILKLSISSDTYLPVIYKQLVVEQNLAIRFTVYDKDVTEEFKKTLADNDAMCANNDNVNNLLAKFDSAKTCRGGPNMYCSYSFTANRAYIDKAVGNWRHSSCPYITPDEADPTCTFCSSLFSILCTKATHRIMQKIEKRETVKNSRSRGKKNTGNKVRSWL